VLVLAPFARAIQELAGHQDLSTQRYMHLGTAAIENAIVGDTTFC
jgi:hypothetical protein